MLKMGNGGGLPAVEVGAFFGWDHLQGFIEDVGGLDIAVLAWSHEDDETFGAAGEGEFLPGGRVTFGAGVDAQFVFEESCAEFIDGHAESACVVGGDGAEADGSE